MLAVLNAQSVATDAAVVPVATGRSTIALMTNMPSCLAKENDWPLSSHCLL